MELPEEIRVIEALPGDYKAAARPEVTEEQYHADLTAVARGDILAALKSTVNWRDYRAEKCESDPEKKESTALRFGRAAHARLLEPERYKAMVIQQPDFGDMRSSKNRAVRDAWLAEQPQGGLIVDEDEFKAINGIVESFLRHPIAERLLTPDCTIEAPFYARCPITGLKLRCKPDFVNPSFGAMVDFKTTQDIEEDKFSASIWNYRYDLQMAFYRSIVRQAVGWQLDNCVIVAAEKKRPYEVAVYPVNEASLEVGELYAQAGLRRIERAIRTGQFQPYQRRAVDIALPHYAFYKAELELALIREETDAN